MSSKGTEQMPRPTKAHAAVVRFTWIASTVLVGACSANVMIDAPPTPPSAVQATSTFAPTGISKALIGVVDGTYSVTFDPTHDQSFNLGPNHLDIPAHSVCNLLTSGYGTAYWNKSCSPQSLPVTLIVTIKGASSDHPSMQFAPAMRFNPTKNVQLFIYAPHVSITDQKNWLMNYCPDSGACIDESLTDSSLQTYIDYSSNVLFRRVKHFSGYTVAERGDDGSGSSLSGGM
jgi:hypothetical protein